MDSNSRPIAVFYAGTNGSGKSTLREINPIEGIKIIDPDMIARRINPENPRSVDIQAGREATNLFREVLKNKVNFSLETTLSGKSAVNKIKLAKEAGFEVHLFYIGLDKVEKNIERVNERVKAGGHYISEEDIRRRYTDSMSNLAKAIEFSDCGTLFSNIKRHEAIYSFKNHKIALMKNEPEEWAKKAVEIQKNYELITMKSCF